MSHPDLYVIANGGRIRAFEIPGKGEPHLESESEHLSELDIPEEQSTPQLTMPDNSDRSGRFEKGDNSNFKAGLAGGERHSLVSEKERRLAIALAKSIEGIVANKNVHTWELIAPQDWIGRVLENLPAEIQASLIETRHGDWTGLPISEIESRLIT